jgi:hypothetical protein
MAAGAPAAVAHHSYAMFDKSRTVAISGTVKEWDWTSPHIYMYIDVVDPQKGAITYALEGGSPIILERLGWTKHVLTVGDKITARFNPLKDGRPGGYFVSVTKADGTLINGDPAAADQPRPAS